MPNFFSKVIVFKWIRIPTTAADYIFFSSSWKKFSCTCEMNDIKSTLLHLNQFQKHSWK